MKCQSCKFDNPDGMKFCGECGQEIHPSCPHCGFTNPPNFKFCGNCGCGLSGGRSLKVDIPPQLEEPPISEEHQNENACYGPDSERKCVTVMFSDLTGYTEMSEKLDPEEVKEITSAIFGELTKIIEKYDGFIEKYIGDAILAVFGAKVAFEDSALRAIKAARELHAHVESVSPRYEKHIGRTLTMHTGINTGVVVTGEINFEKGTHGLVGDTINTAARLMGVSKAGEIIVDQNTFNQVEGYFQFEPLVPVKVKGKAQAIQVYRIGKTLQQPMKLHRLHGHRSELIGRSTEMQVLEDAAERLSQFKSSVIAVCGTAGTGKSRLVHDFKQTLDIKKIQWFDANAYPYTQNTPYFPLIDLLSKAFGIQEGDSADTIKHKVEASLIGLLGKDSGKTNYIGSLFGIEYQEISGVSPEYWKEQLFIAVREVLTALMAAGPVVVCIEDMHWADPSFMQLMRRLVADLSGPLLLICIYRPTISFMTDFEKTGLKIDLTELRLKELSPSETQSMVSSLLKSEKIPRNLRGFIRDNVEGNPFYIEELINSLIDSEVLSIKSDEWVLTRPIDQSGISTNIQGVIAGRIDRLGPDTKRILQEASVIGRAFLFEILQQVSAIKTDIEKSLTILERLDLISAKSIQPTLEYIFKHALTHEIVYNGLVKAERYLIHEKIGNVIELLFQDRLSEFYETLAFHFSRSNLDAKAVDYLLKAGQRCLAKFAADEAHRYFKKAYDIITSKEEISEADKIILIDILNNWGYSFYYLGEFNEFVEIFSSNMVTADSLEDKASVGMFYAWYGIALLMAGNAQDSYGFLCKSLKLGEKAGAQKVVGYACTWLTITCAEIGHFSEGIGYGERAQAIAELYPSDQYLFFKSLFGLSWIYLYMGNSRDVFAIADRLLEYGEINANSRSKVFGIWMKAFGYLTIGDMKSCQEYSKKAMEVAIDPYYTQFPLSSLGMSYFLNGQFHEAENVCKSALDFSKKRGIGQVSVFAQCYLAPVLIAKGKMSQGMKMLKEAQENLIKNNRVPPYAMTEFILGEVNSQIATGSMPSFSVMAKNIGFLAKYVPAASNNAEKHYRKAIEIYRDIGMRGFLGIALMRFGIFYKARKRSDEAKQCLLDAIEILQECGAVIYLEKANKALDSLE